jgi:hypothetical protein
VVSVAPEEPPALSGSWLPVVVALVLVLVVGGLAFAFLRPDDEGELVRPDRLTALDEDTIRVVARDHPACGTVDRAQVDLADEGIFVELVVVGADGPCPDVVGDLVAEIDLPEPIGDRRLIGGVGRTPLPCTGTGTDLRCAAAP